MDDYSLIWIGVLAIILCTWLWGKKIQRDIDRMHVEIQELLSKIIFMKVEKHSDVMYAYNAFNNEFVCQGKNLADLDKQFKLRHPGCRGIIVEPEKEISK